MIDRRRFLQTSVVGLSATALASAADTASKDRPIKKALKIGMVGIKGTLLDKFKALKELGFDGVEMDSPNNLKTEEVLKARDASGLLIPGVVDSAHWNDTLSHPDAKVRQRGVKALETALKDARSYGATSVLLVPAVVNKEVSYDQAYQRSQAEIKKVLELAEKLNVKIALENVWNNFLLSPLETAQYIDEFKSPYVCAHFDIGNVVRYGYPEQWIRILNKRIFKLDVKEYSRKKADNEGVWKGFNAELLEGDCDWPAVMAALREIKYTGWGAAEIPGGGRERLQKISQLMDRCFAS